ncbi:MAG: hypothetical protein GY898_20585 [Proteobacteria bacterium]|nr:hypothetical protein [Pseudomonadota bacterium]
MRRFTLMLMAVVLASGCKPPPPAPEGLDASSAYLIREFHAADDVFDAGLQGFMEWFDDEGFELVGERATSDTTDAFTVGDLSDTDISYLPVVSGRDIEAAAGIVSLSDMDCEVAQSEALLVRPDQFNVFADDWDAYDRTFDTDRDAYEDATDYAPIDEAQDVFAEDWDGGAFASTLMITSNVGDPAPELGGLADLPGFPLFLHFRHGVHQRGEVAMPYYAILSFNPDAVSNEAETQHLHQSFTIEINIEQTPGRTLRMLALWTEIQGAGLSSDDALSLNYAVNKAQASAERLSAICAGEIEI